MPNFSLVRDKSNALSSEEEASSFKRRSIRSATDGGTLSMNCSSMSTKFKRKKKLKTNFSRKKITNYKIQETQKLQKPRKSKRNTQKIKEKNKKLKTMGEDDQKK